MCSMRGDYAGSPVGTSQLLRRSENSKRRLLGREEETAKKKGFVPGATVRAGRLPPDFVTAEKRRGVINSKILNESKAEDDSRGVYGSDNLPSSTIQTIRN